MGRILQMVIGQLWPGICANPDCDHVSADKAKTVAGKGDTCASVVA